MLTGAHAIVYSSNAEADRAFFRDVLKLGSVDAGGGWLIVALRTVNRGHASRRRQTGGLPAPSRAPDLGAIMRRRDQHNAVSKGMDT